ncbi:Uncharacterised protein [Cedecea lapagei]|uniref:Uncharacterized protein n=1 Tax=Cedecea lapagei TaxID=158823 RepID=A0A447V8H1_9ENTR|nr:hypothetical protein [Cedecea lapagei]VEC01995.1 Uncharacterised protein [Cedecea lapagei]
MIDPKNTVCERKNIWQDAGIAPLDYCTIERASKLLNCEISDIWHWRSRYYIDFYANADFSDFVEARSTIQFKKNADAIIDLLLSCPEEVPFVFPFLAPVGDVKVTPSISGALGLFQASKPFDASQNDQLFERTDDNSLVANSSIASGLLRVSGVMRHTQHPREAGEHYIKLNGRFDCELYKFEMQSKSIYLSSLADSNIYLIKSDLEYLYESMLAGDFDSVESAKRSDRATTQVFMQGIKDINHSAERHASNREKLFKSAIYLLSKYPDECRGKFKEISPEKWRDCIQKHKSEIPPLTITNEDVILKHLRTAVNAKG